MIKEKFNRTASVLLAAAMVETFPGVTLLGGSDTSSGFYYDFILSHPVHPQLHSQLEEVMRKISKEKWDIRSMEMVAVSAREFLKKHGADSRAELVQGGGLFSVVQMGSFVDLVSGELLANSRDLACFKLFPPEPLIDGGWRFSGLASDSKEGLKESVKLRSEYAKIRHEVVGIERKWWVELQGGVCFLPEGLKEKARLIDLCKKNLFADSLEVGCSLEALWTVKDLFPEVPSLFCVAPRVFEEHCFEEAGLFAVEEGTVLQGLFSFKNRISCLQSIVKTLNILSFKYHIRLTRALRNRQAERELEGVLREMGLPFQEVAQKEEAPRIDFCVRDGLGRDWSAISVCARKCLDVQVIVERNLAFLLEL